MSAQYTLGLDYGTNSVRTLIVNTDSGKEVATAVWGYEHGTAGVILARDPNLARQHPADYVKGAEVTVKKALADAKKHVRGFKPEQVIGIGVDTTGSTPLPVDKELQGYFAANIRRVEKWFNVISPKGSSVERLKRQIAMLAKKDWQEVFGT